ncbi:hypothetical protein Hanom_Chr03g00254941 [Helianthus anomalus]
MVGGATALKLVKPKNRSQATNIQAASTWGVAAFTTAVWLIQLFLHRFVSVMIGTIVCFFPVVVNFLDYILCNDVDLDLDFAT